MISAALAMMMAGPPVFADDLRILEGHCDYPRELGGAGPKDTRIPCDTVVISPSREPNSILVQFAMKQGSGGPIGFAGDVDNTGSLAIRRIYLRPGVPMAATRGHCRIFYHGEDVSGVTCVGFVGQRSYTANFRAFAP